MIYTVTLNPALDVTVDIDAFEFNGVVRPICQKSQAGGKGFNVSRILNLFGVENTALGFLGGDIGHRIQRDLTAENIAHSIFKVNGETRTNMVFRDKVGKYFKVNEAGPEISQQEWLGFKDSIKPLLNSGDIWVLSGSLPLGVPITAYAELGELIHLHGGQVLLDTSGEAFCEGLKARPDIIKPNQFEAWESIGHQCSYAEILAYFHELGVETVCLSLGSEGLLLSSGGGTCRVKPPVIEEKNAVGAGDAAVAGLLFGLVSKMTVPEMTKWSAASGTAAAASEHNQFEGFEAVDSVYKKIQIID